MEAQRAGQCAGSSWRLGEMRAEGLSLDVATRKPPVTIMRVALLELGGMWIGWAEWMVRD